MLWLILSLVAAGAAAPRLASWRASAAYVLVAVPALATLWLLFGVEPGTVTRLEWFPALGAEIALRADPLGRMMGTLVTGIGALVVTFAVAYLGDDRQLGRFLLTLFAFMSAMVGVALSDNVLLLFVFWELTSITSYLLIGFHHEELKSRRNALQALLVTGFGGVAMLVGLLLMVEVTGTWRISEMVTAAPSLLASPLYPAILVLVLLGAFTKSAQFPFHFWLPNAMAAPTPVSAFLHSATMVKAGVFLLARMDPLLGGTPAWQGALLAAGLITFILGGVAGYCQTDLKRVLAYTTCSILGALTALLALPGETARAAFVLLLVAHAFYKAALFMVVGTIDHSVHDRDWRNIGKLAKVLPITAGAALLAAASKAGVPPLLGFLAKEKGYMAGVAGLPGGAWLVTSGFLIGNILMVALAIRVAWSPFWARPLRAGHKSEAHGHHVDPHGHGEHVGLFVGPVLLALLGVLAGTLLGLTQNGLLRPVLGEWFGVPSELKLKLYHGINLPLVLSVVTVLGGVALHAFARSAWWVRVSGFSFNDPCERAYEGLLAGTLRSGAWVTARLQSGDMRQYVAIILLTTIGLVGYQLWLHQGGFTDITLSPLEPVPLVAGGLIVAGAIGAVLARRRFMVLTWLSVAGFAIAWWFLYFSGPDLALTLLSVETLTILLLALSVRRLPDPLLTSRVWVRVARGALAAASGVMIAWLLLKAKWVEITPKMSGSFVERSIPEGKGTNVVNVILVDFRALDTLGEITVLAIAALGVVGLLAAGRSVVSGARAEPTGGAKKGEVES